MKPEFLITQVDEPQPPFLYHILSMYEELSEDEKREFRNLLDEKARDYVYEDDYDARYDFDEDEEEEDWGYEDVAPEPGDRLDFFPLFPHNLGRKNNEE